MNPEEVLTGKKEYEALEKELVKTLRMFAQYDKEMTSPTITTTVENLCTDIKQELQDLKGKIGQDRLGRLRKESRDLDNVLRCYNRIRDNLQRVSLNIDISMWKTVDELTMENRLRSLQPALSACYNSAKAVELKRGPCTQGTRVDVLGQITSWVATSSPGSVYWMNGMAGTGKTTIAYSLCEEFTARGKLAASFFCSRLIPECRDANRIIPSIAYQMARSSHPLRSVLSGILEKDPDAHTRMPHLQFDALIAQPLLKVKDTLPGNLVIVIDALDECHNKESTRRVLDVLLTRSTNLPVKFLVSSRPEPEIRDNMTKQNDPTESRMVLHELGVKAVQEDIETYLRTALAPVRPTKVQILKLAEQAGVLFIYAATAVRYIGYDNFQRNPSARLTDILSISPMGDEKKHVEIDQLYTTVLRAALDDPNLTNKEVEDMRQVLHTAICAQEPLTVDGLSKLLGMNDVDQVNAALRPLWSVLHVSSNNEIVTTLHTSFSDYMLDPLRSGSYHFDPQTHHQILALRCFDCFRKITPQFNICALKSSFIPDDEVEGLEEQVSGILTADRLYAARYWAVHLHSATASPHLVQELEEFLSVRLLLWMEVMNLKKCTSAMPEAIGRVEQRYMADLEDLRALIHDAWRFTSAFASSPVSRSTPHIYISMLPFWPEHSPIAKLYTRRLHGMCKVNGTATSQRQLALLVTRYFKAITSSPTFSPNGTQVAVGVGENILLLSPSTGQRMLPPLEGHRHWVTSVQFSPDGTRIASGSKDNTIRVWSTQTGESILGPLKEHTDTVWSVAFSPKGSQIVSGSHDETICIWDAYSGELLLGRHKGLGGCGPIRTVQYSSDECYIISLGDISGITVRDAKTGEVLKMLCQNGTDVQFRSFDISPNGKYVASGSWGGDIHVWDIRTGQLVLGPLNIANRSFSIKSIRFSNERPWIASGSYDGTVSIWDARTGDLLLGPLEGHTRSITSLSFSPDSAYIVSGSNDHTLRLWDTRSVQMVPNPLHGHTDAVTLLNISQDGTRVVSGSEDGSIYVWDTGSGDMVASIPKGIFAHIKWPIYEANEEQSTKVLQVVFSPDGTRIIVNTNNGPFALDTNTGSLRSLHVCHASPTNCLLLIVIVGFITLVALFSNPGNCSVAPLWIPSLARTLLVRFLGLVLGSLTMGVGLQIRPNGLNTLIFQPIVIIVTSIFVFGDAIFGPVDLYSPHISCAGFSPDGTRIISGSADGIIRLYDIHTNQLRLVISLPAIDKCDLRVNSVSFSPDGRRIFSQSGKQKQQMHCAETGKLLANLNEAEWDYAIGFSPDGTRIVTRHGVFIALVDLDTRQSLHLKEISPSGICLRHLSSNLFTFTADGSLIACAVNQGIGIWSAHTGESLLDPIKVGLRHLRCMAYSSDGGYIVTGSDGGTICITDALTTTAQYSGGSPSAMDWRMTEAGPFMVQVLYARID
ncbi:hypothetical protein OPQ81_005469 [Rhizoctonia solani]|nr:hypothetical protein OPQ81_005469 [Rhizoctonia solani]